MTNIITSKDTVIKTFKQFCDFLKEKRQLNSLPENYIDYIPTIVWGDIFGKRIYFKDNGMRYFWVFKKYTLDSLVRKLNEAGIAHCSIDTSSISYVLYESKKTNKQKRHYL